MKHLGWCTTVKSNRFRIQFVLYMDDSIQRISIEYSYPVPCDDVYPYIIITSYIRYTFPARMHQEDHLASTFTIQQTHKLLIKECMRLHSKYGYTPVNIARIIIIPIYNRWFSNNRWPMTKPQDESRFTLVIVNYKIDPSGSSKLQQKYTQQNSTHRCIRYAATGKG